MREYSDRIALIENTRGIYGIDTCIGCGSGMAETVGGCYGDCYAAKSAKLYGYDFTKTVLRRFTSLRHERQIVAEINRVKLDFVRIGCSGDPSENWEHTVKIIRVLSRSNKEIVIITRHWNALTDEQLTYLSGLNICINTSVSALDRPEIRQHCVEQYLRVKRFCKSVLRVVSCDFNLDNSTGHRLFKIQKELFLNEDVLDTVFRPSRKNRFVLDGVLNVKNGVFNGHRALMSKYNKKTYTGKCSTCKEMCGVTMKNDTHTYEKRKPIIRQLSINLIK